MTTRRLGINSCVHIDAVASEQLNIGESSAITTTESHNLKYTEKCRVLQTSQIKHTDQRKCEISKCNLRLNDFYTDQIQSSDHIVVVFNEIALPMIKTSTVFSQLNWVSMFESGSDPG